MKNFVVVADDPGRGCLKACADVNCLGEDVDTESTHIAHLVGAHLHLGRRYADRHGQGVAAEILPGLPRRQRSVRRVRQTRGSSPDRCLTDRQAMGGPGGRTGFPFPVEELSKNRTGQPVQTQDLLGYALHRKRAWSR